MRRRLSTSPNLARYTGCAIRLFSKRNLMSLKGDPSDANDVGELRLANWSDQVCDILQKGVARIFRHSARCRQNDCEHVFRQARVERNVALREVGWSLVEGGSSPVTPAWFASGTVVPLSFDITEPNKMAVSETHGVPSKPTMPVHPALRRSVKTRSPLGDDRGTEGSLRRVDKLGSSPPAHCNATHPSAAINANAAYSFGNYLGQDARQRGPPLR